MKCLARRLIQRFISAGTLAAFQCHRRWQPNQLSTAAATHRQKEAVKVAHATEREEVASCLIPLNLRPWVARSKQGAVGPLRVVLAEMASSRRGQALLQTLNESWKDSPWAQREEHRCDCIHPCSLRSSSCCSCFFWTQLHFYAPPENNLFKPEIDGSSRSSPQEN